MPKFFSSASQATPAAGSTAGAPPLRLPPVPLNEKWDHSVECALRKTSLGVAAGLVPALVFARSAAARAAVVMFCAGIGAGVSYAEARYLFDRDVTFDQRHTIHLEWAGGAAPGSASGTAAGATGAKAQ